uniref:Glucose-6-phosphatase n=1 Tax=Gouania willdenowi TaxID=441366 RepID=A0A8C5HFW1_GOUWI
LAMDLLHSWGVEVCVHLQKSYAHWGAVFSLASAVADLHTVYFCLFPVWFHLHRNTALRLIWTAALVDWVNLLLKWVLFGERPYWWVHESHFYGPGTAPTLQQFPITCETGPGSPSGHAMGSSAVWYVMVTSLLSIAAQNKCSPLKYRFLQMFLWMLMVLVQLVVGMSRVYVATHFPHQMIFGVISGVLVAKVVSRFKWIYSATLRTYLLSTLFLSSFAMGFNLLLKVWGVDLLWTLAKCQKWCTNPEWIHLDSSLFASLVRNMGTLFGLGFGLHSPLGANGGTSGGLRGGLLVLSVLLVQLLDVWTFSSENHAKFFTLLFVKSAIAMLIPTALVPWTLSWISPQNKKKL